MTPNKRMHSERTYTLSVMMQILLPSGDAQAVRPLILADYKTLPPLKIYKIVCFIESNSHLSVILKMNR
jgi:hypothetical protein